MSQLEGKALVSALMHEDTFMAGVGSIRKELHTKHDGINQEVTLALEGDLVIVGVKPKAGGKLLTLAIPVSNFKQLVYA